MRAATYARASTGDQDPGLTRDELRAHAARLGAELALEIEEHGSGTRADRPGWQRILSGARRGEFDVLIAHRVDRLARSLLDLEHGVRMLHAAGVRVIVVSQGLDLRPDGDAVSALTMQILGACAQFERSLIAARCKAGLDKARRYGTRSGRPIGRPRAIDKPTAEQVQTLRSRGMSWTQVAKHLGCTPAKARRRVAAR